MDEFIDRLTAAANIDRQSALRVTQIFLRMATVHLSAPVSFSLFKALPGAFDLTDEQTHLQRRLTIASGIEGMMLSAMKNALGYEDPLIAMLADVKAAGLKSGQALLAGQEFLKFAEEKAGSQVLRRVTDKIPGLRRLN
ncbi:MAG: hypothetical protein SGJ17_12605 [Hyphomicrobiales bacterium]|nr:hypothetical protein [Hyphomicrobiales bacterium]